MQFPSTPRRTIIALLGATGLMAGSGVAAAQISPMALPGTDDSTIQVAVGQDEMAEVTVDSAGADATEITGTFTNTSGGPLTCAAPGGGGDAGTVTEADLVDRSLAYLTGDLITGGGGLGIPGLNPGSVDVILGTGSLGSLGLGDPAAVELDAIQQAQDEERLKGHYGTVESFTLADGATKEWTATLSVPSGDRTDFEAAALFTCSQDDQWYAFAGYEENDDADSDTSGSLGSGSLGS